MHLHFLGLLLAAVGLLCLVRTSEGIDIQGDFVQDINGVIQVIFGVNPPQSSPDQSNPRTGKKTVVNLVFAHHIVGNTYNYDMNAWSDDIKLASSKGIDAFALNVGRDAWEPDQIANAYTAAENLNTTFKLFLSFDMTSLPCENVQDADLLRQYITTYAQHPNQLLYNGGVFVSTFAGENCLFGSSNVNQGWLNTLKTDLPSVYFVPSFFVDPRTFPTYTVMDGIFNWNSGWPMGNYNISFSSDRTYMTYATNKTYMASVSPWFFTHYGIDTYNKNFIYRGDDWLFAQRWEILINHRRVVPFAEVVTWNDYGESSYVGPIKGVQPMSESWVNGFDHQGWLDLMQYYISAFKTGRYPLITKDRIFIWARLYPRNVDAPNDHVGRPDHWEWTQDTLWAIVLLTSPANVTLNCGPSTQTSSLPSGLSKLSLNLSETCDVSSSITRDSVSADGSIGGPEVTTFSPPGFRYTTSAPSYNFNAFVVASSA